MVMKAVQDRPSCACETRIPSRIRIKTILASLNLTQSALARELNVSPQYIHMIVNGKKRLLPDNPIFVQIADRLGQSVDALFPLVDLEAIAKKTTLESPPLVL